jgi:predicted DNA-binding protein
MNDPEKSNDLITYSYALHEKTKQEYSECKKKHPKEQCARLHDKLHHQLHELSKNLTTMSIAVKNKSEKKVNDIDPAFIHSKNVGYLGDMNDYQLDNTRHFDYISFAWIIVTTFCIFLVLFI